MQFDRLWDGCRAAFSSRSGWRRAKRLALSAFVCLGRHTITGLLCAGNRQNQDWSADYRLFSRKRFFPAELFGAVRRAAAAMTGPDEPLIVSVVSLNCLYICRIPPFSSPWKGEVQEGFDFPLLLGGFYCLVI